MATIDNLWDEPVESESVHLATRPVTSSEDPLFLRSDSEDEGGTSAAGPRQSKAPEDIGALFDVDDDDNGQLSNVTYEQLQRDALSGGNMLDDGPSSRENQEANEGPSEGVSNANSMFDKKNEDGKAAGTRRTIPKLDEDLLLSEKGIPALIKDAKRWRPKGKGHEISDLNRLIRTYQYWAHQMYPRHTFNDTIERVERLTHSRRMHVALSVWHDEARGMSRHQEPPGESFDIDGINSDDDEDQAQPSGSRQTSEPPTRPPSSASERTSDFDADGELGEKSTGMQGGGDELDFEVEMWDDAPFIADPMSTSTNLPKPSARPTRPLNNDEDQDMWDLVDELQVQVKSNEGAKPPIGPPAPVDDDDWDSMYA